MAAAFKAQKEKSEKAAEVEVKQKKEAASKKNGMTEQDIKSKKEKKAKVASEKAVKAQSAKEEASKVDGEKSSKEKFVKGEVIESHHKKETVTKELKSKKGAYLKWKESYTKGVDESQAKKTTEYKQKCGERKAKFSKEKANKVSGEVKEKQIAQEKKMKPEIRSKEWSHKESVRKSTCERKAKGYKEALAKSNEKLTKAADATAATKATAEKNMKISKIKLEAQVKLLKSHKKEAASKKEMGKKTEAKQKFFTASEKKEKASEKTMKGSSESVGKEVAVKEKASKKVEHENYQKQVMEVKKKAQESAAKKVAECRAKEAASKEARAKKKERTGKSPFSKVAEINVKLQEMKETYAKRDKVHKEADGKYATKEQQVKFSWAKEKFFKKYSNSTRELDNKKESFQKSCKMEKEKLTKINLAKLAYSEGKNKKSCVDTRTMSALNNQKMVNFFDGTIKKIEDNCALSQKLDAAKRIKFVWGVCKGVHGDVTTSISKVMTDMDGMGFGVTDTKVAKKAKAAKKELGSMLQEFMS
jgi:hypothetical protein